MVNSKMYLKSSIHIDLVKILCLIVIAGKVSLSSVAEPKTSEEHDSLEKETILIRSRHLDFLLISFLIP